MIKINIIVLLNDMAGFPGSSLFIYLIEFIVFCMPVERFWIFLFNGSTGKKLFEFLYSLG